MDDQTVLVAADIEDDSIVPDEICRAIELAHVGGTGPVCILVMCCFTGPVSHVDYTNIFAAPTSGTSQVLVYQMSLRADDDVAMVLPLPVPRGTPEDALRFIDMQACEDFFLHLAGMFGGVRSADSVLFALAPAAVKTLPVHDVGDYEASFVPNAPQFARLDPRFRLSERVLAALPIDADWGFAVFQLRSPGGSSVSRKVHPIAFEFPRRDPGALFFPTVHVHDGELHAEADFNHTLYCQRGPTPPIADASWSRAYYREDFASRFTAKCPIADIVRPGEDLYRRTIQGRAANRDVYVRV